MAASVQGVELSGFSLKLVILLSCNSLRAARLAALEKFPAAPVPSGPHVFPATALDTLGQYRKPVALLERLPVGNDRYAARAFASVKDPAAAPLTGNLPMAALPVRVLPGFSPGFASGSPSSQWTAGWMCSLTPPLMT